jgi:hypothetical protein
VLTLITCYPFWVFGRAPDRFVVRAAAVVNGAGARPPSRQAPLPDAVAAAFSDGSSVHRAARSAVGLVHNDETLVRLTVERYRLAYNGRLSREAVRSSEPLRFQTCEVAVAGDRATATCEARRQSFSDPAPGVRTFMLERTASEWAIRSIEVR